MALLYSDMGHALALGFDECIEEGAGGALGQSSPGVWATWDFEAAWEEGRWVVPGVGS